MINTIVSDLDFREWMENKHPVLYKFLWNQFSEYERKNDKNKIGVLKVKGFEQK
jgi:hypothetical protein